MFGYRNTAKSGVTTAQPEPSRSGGALRRGFLLASLTCLSFLAVLAGAAAAQEVTFSSSSYSVNEGDAVTPELVLSHARSEAVTVHIEVMGFQAKGGEDFAAGPWDVTVPAGRTRQSFSIATFGDYKAEGSEQFLLHIPPDGHSDGVRRSTSGTPDAVVTISDSTKISARSDRLRVVEDGTATINLAIGTPARPTAFTIDYTLSGATASGADVTGGFGARSITVPANATSVEIPIETAQDTVTGEDVEWFQVRLSTSVSSVRFTTTDIRIGIVDDDTARISVPDPKVQVTEGGTATVRVAIEYPKSSSFTLGYTLSSESASAADVVGGFGARSITVPANASHVDISIATAQDTVHSEGVEWVRVRLSTTASGVVFDTLEFQVGIADDDTAAFFTSASERMDERAHTRNAEVRLTPPPTSAVTLTYTVDGTATPGVDYQALSGSVAVGAGATTARIPVTIIDDDDQEPRETVVLTLTGGSGYQVGDPDTHTVTIAASEVPSKPRVEFVAPNYGRYPSTEWVNEDAGTRGVRLRLSWAYPFDITINYAVRDAGATSGSDYAPLSGKVTVPAGTTTATIPVTIIDDNDQEGDEIFYLELADGDDYRVNRGRTSNYKRELVIHDNEGLPTVSFASASQNAVEGSGTRNVTVNLSPAPDETIGLRYRVGGTATAGSDYTALPGTLAVPAGATTATIPVTALADSVQENSETVVLTLLPGTGYWVSGTDSVHTLNIHSPSMVTFRDANSFAREQGGTRKVAVNLSPAPTLGKI